MSNCIESLYKIIENCVLCPQNCKVNRFKNEKGVCKLNHKLKVSSSFLHFGEEAPLVARNGSGTIFFSGCNLKCIFCQNYELSHFNEGVIVSVSELANTMLSLQTSGALNINLVTPTHQVPQIVDAILLAKDRGLIIPIVYNCGGYESLETLKLIDGIIDIYMPDIKYFNDDYAKKFSKAKNYTKIVKAAVKEMHRQVGDLIIDSRGVARRGLLIRHLVLPNNICESKKILDFIAKEISRNTYVNIMDQYRPAYQASQFEELKYPVYLPDYWEIIDYAKNLGLTRGLEKSPVKRKIFF